MSKFRSMTVTVAKDVTENGGYFHEITVTDTHEGRLSDVMDAFENARYEVVSVLIDGYDFEEDMWQHIGHMSNVAVLFDALCDDAYSADVICAFILENDCADADKWYESIYFSGNDHETVVREWADSFHKVYSETASYYSQEYAPADPFPSWMNLDWEATLNKIASENSDSVVEFNDMVYYFG